MNPSVVKFINQWVKPAGLIILIFLIGFAIPVLIKDYLGEKTGIAPTPTPTIIPKEEFTGPYYRFEPEKIKLSVSDKKQIKLYLNTDQNPIQAFDFIATYDPKFVEVTAIEATPLYPSYPEIEFGQGKIIVSGNIGFHEKAFAVNDILLLITLEGKTPGKTTLKLDKKQSTIATMGENILKGSNSLEINVL